MFAEEDADLIDPDLGRFFKEPFESFDVLGGGHRHVQAPGPAMFAGSHLHDLHQAALVVDLRQPSLVKFSKTVGDVDQRTYIQAEHPDTMPRFLFAQHAGVAFNTGDIKQLHGANLSNKGKQMI